MNVYERIGLQRVINASGRVTKLGVSTISAKVAEAAVEGAQSYVLISDLYKRAGEIIAEYTKAEDGCPTCSAAAGIAISVAAVISKGDKSLVKCLPDSNGRKNEVIIQKGHSVDFGAPIVSMIRLGGGIPKEVGTVNEVSEEEIENNISENTAALMYVKSHHCVQNGMVSLEKMVNIAHGYNLPIIVDAAAEEDFEKYAATGADLVIYSGAKALESCTSGFITGKKEYMNYCRQQYEGIGRAMKVGKDQIMGLLAALQQYKNKDMVQYVNHQLSIVDFLVDEINRIKGLKAYKSQDEAGREIYRCEVKVDETIVGKSAYEIDRLLKEGQVMIVQRGYNMDQGILTFDPRPMLDGDKELIVDKLKKIIQ